MRVRDPHWCTDLMARQGLTYDTLAERCRITRSAMWKRVHGHVQVDEVAARRMARVLGAPVRVLFDVEPTHRHAPTVHSGRKDVVT